MLGSAILDVAVGLILIYLLCSLICTALREVIELLLKSRAVQLERGIRAMLDDAHGDGLTAALYNHPVVSALYDGKYSEGAQSRTLARRKLPSYIPSRNFALALLDIVVRGKPTKESPQSEFTDTGTKISCQNIRENLGTLKNPSVQRVLLMALDVAQDDIRSVQAQIEAWYESGMDRVSGWYKKQSQWIVLALGFAVAIVANVNSVRVAQYLSRNSAAREALVAQAGAIAQDSTIQTAQFDRVNTELNRLGVPIGWSEGWNSLRAIPAQTYASNSFESLTYADMLGVAIGWLATALAISLGAPFWFDLLNRFTVIRSTIKPDETKYVETASPPSTRSTHSTWGVSEQTVITGQNGSSGRVAAVMGSVAAGSGLLAFGENSADQLFTPQIWSSGDPEEGIL
jgi:hypothetical protein